METIMNRVIMIKYGELTTKKSNRKLFINALYNNILNKLEGMEVNIRKDISRMYIEFNDSDLENILKKINYSKNLIVKLRFIIINLFPQPRNWQICMPRTSV